MNKHHGRKPFVAQLEATQFALERAVKDVAALKKQCDGLAKLNKAQEIRINETDLQLSRFCERFMKRIGDVEKRLAAGDPE